MPASTAITIGSFDGVHVGHAALLDAARTAVGPAGRIIALAFFPHPLTTLRPDAAPARLTNWRLREELLLRGGVSEAVRLAPTPELLGLEPRAFVERMVREYAPTVWVEGPDFRFGKARAGDVDTLAELGDEFGFETIIVPVQEIALNDLTLVPASSTLARWLIAHGRIADARCALGRDYELTGTVAPGDQRGRDLGFPTANIEVDSMPPADGVYAGLATLPNGDAHPAAISVGSKPTFGDRPRTVEAYVLDWDGAIDGETADYGWEIRVTFFAWLREQIAYSTLESLVDQIERDVARTRAIAADRAPLAATGGGKRR